MNLIYYFYKQSWKLLLVAILTGVISGVAAASLIAIISKGVAGRHPDSIMGLSFFALCLFYLLTKSYSQISMLHLVQRATLQLRINLSAKLLATPMKHLHALGKSRLLVILTQDVEKFISAFQVMPTAFGSGVVILASLGYMAILSWQLLLLFCGTLAASLSIYRLAQRRPTRRMVELRETTDALYANFRNLIEGSKELKLNSSRGAMFVDQIIKPDAEEFKRLYIVGFTGYAWALNSVMTLMYLFIGLVLFVFSYWLPQTPETLTAIVLILLYINGPINLLMSTLPVLSQAGVALKKIQQLEATLTVESVDKKRIPDPFVSTKPLALQLNGVSHTYAGAQGGEFTLGPINLDIQCGEIVFIIGGNGSGKTTLAMLLLGLYEPIVGHVALNGVTVTDENRDCYRQYFSAVFSDFHLFEHLLGEDQQDLRERATGYLRSLQIDHKVHVAEGKFSSTDLSAGQRKRLALVSAYLEDRDFYLFDEWAADQDPAFKRVFYTELLPDLKARGKTVIVITHDDAYFSYADRTIRLEDGNLKSLPRSPATAGYAEFI